MTFHLKSSGKLALDQITLPSTKAKPGTVESAWQVIHGKLVTQLNCVDIVIGMAPKIIINAVGDGGIVGGS